MSDQTASIPWLDYQTFEENRRRFPHEELMKYVDQSIAWSWDGTSILACGKDHADVHEKLVAMGIDPSRVVFSWVDDPDVSQL
jgi:hypothetical protein